jgi:CRISPR-associated endonuclease/helicase Cas3
VAQSQSADSSTIEAQLSSLWGKSKSRGGGSMNLLLEHLFDTAAVAELMWDAYLAPSTQALLDRIAGGPGRGRRLFVWLCGIHDCGKATPAFQRMDAEGAAAVRAAGLSWREPVVAQHRWRHDRAGGRLILDVLRESGWSEQQVSWVWPLVAGHHGLFPSAGQLREPGAAGGQLQGRGAWPGVQRALLDLFAREMGASSLADLQPVEVPSRAEQLALSGLVVMADWIASDERFFSGISDWGAVSLIEARRRAANAWAALGLTGGWGHREVPGDGLFRERFGEDSRPSQQMVVDAARRMPVPGLMVVEAPMGEGKTKAALAAAEVLAARFGADGVFVGMPTQATCDPMFDQVRSWVASVDPGLASRVALLHGKRMFNQSWRALLEAAGADPDGVFAGVDEFGCCDDDYGMTSGDPVPERLAPAEWFLGRLRGLLCPVVVGTIDQLLYAATRTKHVMLRMAGLVGKVVVLDEVHAADVYMSQFLKEGLRWLGQARVPVVLLSATLSAAQREELIEAYLVGAEASSGEAARKVPSPAGYPCVTVACPDADGITVDYCASWRADLPIQVEVLEERRPAKREDAAEARQVADRAVADLLAQRLAAGGCALVVRNTVDRAQSLYQELRGQFGDDVRLLHGQLTVAERADRTGACLEAFGVGGKRPGRLVLVATQLAEQSFDIDVDLLVTDLAPADLLLQRIGRMHRHDGVARPEALKDPVVVVTGFTVQPDGMVEPEFGSEAIYGRWLLLRTAAVVSRDDGKLWSVPSQVPTLVGEVYGGNAELVPVSWRDDELAAKAGWESKQQERAENAARFLLSRQGEHSKDTLEGLHFAGAVSGGVSSLEAVVRDGERTTEVVLIQRDDAGLATLRGRRLTSNGDVAPELLDEVLGSTVRLPVKVTKAAMRAGEPELRPLSAWIGHSWLRNSRALVLNGDRSTELGGFCVSYDDELGLVTRRSD